MFSICLNKKGGWGAGETVRISGAVIFREENVIYRVIIFFALDHISMHFYSSSQPGAGDTLIYYRGIY